MGPASHGQVRRAVARFAGGRRGIGVRPSHLTLAGVGVRPSHLTLAGWGQTLPLDICGARAGGVGLRSLRRCGVDRGATGWPGPDRDLVEFLAWAPIGGGVLVPRHRDFDRTEAVEAPRPQGARPQRYLCGNARPSNAAGGDASAAESIEISVAGQEVLIAAPQRRRSCCLRPRGARARLRHHRRARPLPGPGGPGRVRRPVRPAALVRPPDGPPGGRAPGRVRLRAGGGGASEPAGGRETYAFDAGPARDELVRVLRANWSGLPPALRSAKALGLQVEWARKASVRRAVTDRAATLRAEGRTPSPSPTTSASRTSSTARRCTSPGASCSGAPRCPLSSGTPSLPSAAQPARARRRALSSDGRSLPSAAQPARARRRALSSDGRSLPSAAQPARARRRALSSGRQSFPVPRWPAPR